MGDRGDKNVTKREGSGEGWRDGQALDKEESQGRWRFGLER